MHSQLFSLVVGKGVCCARLLLATSLVAFAMTDMARAGGVYGNSGLAGGYRWDAALRSGADSFEAGDSSQLERSLQGGLRYSLQGGSYQAYRDLFTWNALPSVTTFQQTIEQAFAAWTEVDPATGLGTALSFAADLDTAVVGTGAGYVNVEGAEIDLFGVTDARFWNPDNPVTQGETFFFATGDPVTLTSGTENYSAGAIFGADITLNSNNEAVYDLDRFRLLLTHEIGHALGFADVDVQSGPSGNFIDDNYSSALPAQTLNNSWAALVNAYDPAASLELEVYTVANDDPGTKTAGVNILMESQGLGGQYGDLTPLSNDDFGIRQFLYPTVSAVEMPEPASALLLLPALVMAGVVLRRQRR